MTEHFPIICPTVFLVMMVIWTEAHDFIFGVDTGVILFRMVGGETPYLCLAKHLLTNLEKRVSGSRRFVGAFQTIIKKLKKRTL